MRPFVLGTAAVVGVLSLSPAEAYFPVQPVNSLTLVQTAQCVVRRVRTIRPNGRVVVRTIRDCGGYGFRRGFRPRCEVVQRRVVRPNGRVVFRNVRRCF